MPFVLMVVLGVVFLPTALVLLVGAALPAHFRGQAEVRVPLGADDTWEALGDVEAHPHGADQCREVQGIYGEGPSLCWREDIGSSLVTVQTVEYEPGRRWVRAMRDSIVPMVARWEISVHPVSDDETEVRILQEGTCYLGTWHVPFFRVALFLGAASAGPQAFLDQLARPR